MKKTYTEKIQIYKTNKIAALYPTAKLIIVLLYIVCTLISVQQESQIGRCPYC